MLQHRRAFAPKLGSSCADTWHGAGSSATGSGFGLHLNPRYRLTCWAVRRRVEPGRLLRSFEGDR